MVIHCGEIWMCIRYPHPPVSFDCAIHPTRQDVHGLWADALLWAHMEVFRTSLFVADVEKTLKWRRVRIGRTNYVLRTPVRSRTSGKLSYGPTVGRPLNVTSECEVLWSTLAEWDHKRNSDHMFKAICRAT